MPKSSRPQGGANVTPTKSIASSNAERLTWSYLQDMRAAPLTSPVKDDIGSDIENDGGSYGDFIQDNAKEYDEDELADDYLRRMRGQEPKQKVHGEPLGFGTSTPTKRLDGAGAPSENPWIPSSSLRQREGQSRLSGVSVDHGHSSFLAADLVHKSSGAGRTHLVSDLESQIRDLRIEINKLSTTSPRVHAGAHADFEEKFAEGGGSDAYGASRTQDRGRTWDASTSVPLNDPSHPDFFASVRRDYGSPGAGRQTWAEQVRRQFEDDGLLDAETDRRAAAEEAGKAGGGVGRLHSFGNKKITIPQPFTRMERHAVFRAEKKKMKETDEALKQATVNGKPQDFDRSPIQEQAGASRRFDDEEAALIDRIQGRAAYVGTSKWLNGGPTVLFLCISR